MSHPSKGLTGKEKLYGLPIFWELIQDRMSTTVSNELLELALTSITETLKQPYSKHIRMAFILKSIENLIKDKPRFMKRETWVAEIEQKIAQATAQRGIIEP